MKANMVKSGFAYDTPEIQETHLPYGFKLLYDIETKDQLEAEVEYLSHRLGGIMKLCKEMGQPINEYVMCVLGAERTRWQPIATAPKTGKVLLFYMNSHNLARRVIARWVTDEEAAEIDFDDVGLKSGWYECIDNWDEYSAVAIHAGDPSHWMPLPDPPQVEDRK